MKKIITCTACLLMLFTISNKIFSQSLTMDDIKAQMLKDWQRAKDYTISYLNTMPADKYSFKAVDSLRSFAQQMLHLAAGNVFLMSKATPEQVPSWFGFDIEHSASAQSKDSVMYYVVSSYDYCSNAVKNSDMSKWGEQVSIFGMQVTRYGMMIKTFEHQTHHRGQTTIYIRLNNVIPPQERLFP